MSKINKPHPGEIHIGGGNHLTIKSSYIVEMKDNLLLYTGKGEPVELFVEIKADFEKIPPEWHHTMIQMMAARYGGVVKCYDNTKPFKSPIPIKRKWWQFWVAK